MNLYENTKYIKHVDFLISTYIREYDISKANINVLYDAGLITQTQYNNFMNCSRERRQIAIGLMQQQNPNVTIVLQNGIRNARKQFMESNGLEDEDILSINNDAIFVINKIPRYTKFGSVEFKNKNIYTSYYNISGLQLYYFYDPISGNEKLDVKGIGDENLAKHRGPDSFMEFLEIVFNSAQTQLPKDTLDIIITVYNRYITYDMDINFYRPFNAESRFMINNSNEIFDKYQYTCDTVPESEKRNLNISYNLNIIRSLYSIFSSLQFNMKF